MKPSIVPAIMLMLSIQASLASSVALSQVTWNALVIRRTDPKLYFGVAAVCVVIGTFFYFTNKE